jgi:adenylate cyclase class 2
MFCERERMPVEIEAKMKVPDHASPRAQLQQLGATKVGEFLETNTFFDTEDRSLLAADHGLRIRVKRDVKANTEEFILTLKGPRLHGQLKSREETEVTVANARDMTTILEQLGFRVVLSFEKRRESWTLGGCHVELDDVPHLGTYVEIEGPGEDKVMKVREQLGLSDRPLVKASYIALLMTYLQEHGQSGRQVRFAT